MDQSFRRARTDRNARPVPFRANLTDMARQDSQLAALLQRSDLRFDLRRHSVAVNVPPGARVFEEPSAGSARPGAQDRLHVWAETVNDASRISAVSHFLARSRAKPTQKRSEPRGRRQLRWRDWRGRDAAMGLREKTAPREGDNGSTMARLAQRNRRVDHRQSGAQNQNHRIGRRVPRARVLPWADEWRIERFGGFVSAAQNRHIEDGGLGAGEAERDGAVAFAQTRDDFAKPAHAPRVGLAQTIFDQAT